LKKVMRVNDDFNYPDRTVEAGTLLIVESKPASNGLRYILEGELAFRSVHSDYLEEVDVLEMDEQLKNLQAEVRVSKRRAEIAEADDRRAVAAADRLQDNVVQLNRELREARAKEAAKVPVPREVAGAIDRLRQADISDFAIIALSDKTTTLVRDYPKEILEDLRLVRSFTFNNTQPDAIGETGADILLKALVNGYTVEVPQTFETSRKLTADEIREVRRWYQGSLRRIEDKTDPDEFAKEAIEEVALYLGGAELLMDISRYCKTQLDREIATKSG